MSLIFFVISIITFVYGLSLSGETPEKLSAKLTVNYNNYIGVLEKVHQEKYKTESTNSTKSSLSNSKKEAADERFHEILIGIMTNLNVYSSSIGENPVNKKQFAKYAMNKVRSLSSTYTEAEVILLDLEEKTLSLKNDASRIAKYLLQDDRRINARKFVDWFFKEIEVKQLENVKNNQALVRKAKESKANSVTFLGIFYGWDVLFSNVGIAPTSMLVSLFFFMILIVIRLDEGIRANVEKVKTSYTNTDEINNELEE